MAGPIMDMAPLIVAGQPGSPLARLSLQDLGAIIARPPHSVPGISSGALAFSSLAGAQTAVAGRPGVLASVANSGLASTNQAMVSISFTLVQPLAANPGR